MLSKAVKFCLIPPTHQWETITYTNILSGKSLILCLSNDSRPPWFQWSPRIAREYTKRGDSCTRGKVSLDFERALKINEMCKTTASFLSTYITSVFEGSELFQVCRVWHSPYNSLFTPELCQRTITNILLYWISAKGIYQAKKKKNYKTSHQFKVLSGSLTVWLWISIFCRYSKYSSMITTIKYPRKVKQIVEYFDPEEFCLNRMRQIFN